MSLPGARACAAALVAVVVFGLPVQGAGQVASAPAACAPWKRFTTPELPLTWLWDVAVTSRTNAWAVGNSPPYILHWDGTAWAQAQAKLPSGELEAVSATSPSDAWAVGYRDPVMPLAVHWDGTRWKVVATPVPGTYNYLYGVDGTAPNDAWAVGDYTDDQGFIHPLAMHWDGTSWRVVSVPEAPVGNNVLYAVDAVATDDVWAVGYRGAGPFEFQPLIDHWDGTAWSVVPVTPPVGTLNQLFGVSGTSSHDAWAVGFYGQDAVLLLVEHWDGSAWTQAAVPPLPERDELADVKALSPTDAWAVGVRIAGSYNRPLSLHWDGSQWTPVSAPHPGSSSGFGAVDASSNTNVWAIGAYQGSETHPLAEHTKGCS